MLFLHSYDSSRGTNSMIESHLSQFTEQLQVLITQIAATRLYEMADTVTSRMRTKFQNLAKVCGLPGHLGHLPCIMYVMMCCLFDVRCCLLLSADQLFNNQPTLPM